MKIRGTTLGISLASEDFISTSSSNGTAGCVLNQKIRKAQEILREASESLTQAGYEVQTMRIALNSFEEWLFPLLDGDLGLGAEEVIRMLIAALEESSIQFCTIGNASTQRGMEMLCTLLPLSPLISGSVNFLPSGDALSSTVPDLDACKSAAAVCVKLAQTCGALGNFRYCVSFNCKTGMPFFPAAFHSPNGSASGSLSSSSLSSSSLSALSIGLENGDLCFMAFHAARTYADARENLLSILQQTVFSIQEVMEPLCGKLSVAYAGVDTSVNPGLTIYDSAAAGMENLINLGRYFDAAPGDTNAPKAHFGDMGTLAAVATTTGALKAVNSSPFRGVDLKTTGYCGVMLPVMEDLCLAEGAALSPSPRFRLRDLLTFSSVCGVGLDTVPIPGDATEEQIAAVYIEVAALSFRLNKPLTCRLLPMPGLKAGDLTTVESPYLVNTRVFAIEY